MNVLEYFEIELEKLIENARVSLFDDEYKIFAKTAKELIESYMLK